MGEYYAVIRSKDSIAHYGVQGMKWGVRKAVKSGSDRSLNRQYKKAAKKLAKLTDRTNAKKQYAAYKKHTRNARIAAGIGIVGATIAGLEGRDRLVANRKLSTAPGQSTASPFRKKKIVPGGKGVERKGKGLLEEKLGGPTTAQSVYRKHGAFVSNNINAMLEWAKKYKANSNRRFAISSAVAAAGLGTAAYQKAKAIAAKRRITAKGHAKAVAERNAWKKQMQTAFKGTKYANLPTVQKKTKRHK